MERYDYVYVRNGTASLFLAFEPLARLAARRGHATAASASTGPCSSRSWSTSTTPTRRRSCWSWTSSTRTRPAGLYEAFPPAEAKRLADKLEIHYTPKHGSWLNMAEIEFSALARDLPERVADRPDPGAPRDGVGAGPERRRVAADWRFTTADARIKLRKLYPTIDA